MTTVLASAADARYGYWLLNMLGSVSANSPIFDRVVVYDLGLTPLQRRLLDSVRGVEVRTVSPLVPHWSQGFTWKPWAWTHLEASRIVWLDAGVTVLSPLDELLDQVDRNGYFVVSQGVPVSEIVPGDYYGEFGVDAAVVGDRVAVAAGIIGFDTRSPFFSAVVRRTYEDCLAGKSLGFSPEEAEKLNFGLGRLEELVVRDAPRFRHDQTVLNLRFYGAVAEPVVNDLDKFAGWRSPHDHPEQVIWNHRRRGDFAYLPRVPYRGLIAPFGRLFGLWYRWRWWFRNHSWYFRPATYLGKARRLAERSP